MKKIVLFVCIALMASVGSCYADTGDEAAAVEAADSWLILIDQENYEESWEQTATFFREQVSLQKWINSMKSVEEIVDKVKSRKVISKTYTEMLPGAPKGEYVVIIYQAVLQNGKKAIETVTPMKDVDNQWRVSGYYINPN